MTHKVIKNTQGENSWHYLPLIKALTALAALFHDWGKSSEFFQYKLFIKKPIADPVRHEWVSLLLMSALCKNKSDEEWLKELTEGKVNFTSLSNQLENKTPFKALPNLALVLGWLIVTHHRMPESDPTHRIFDLASQLKRIRADWGYENPQLQDELYRCLQFPKGLVSDSGAWQKAIKKWSRKLLEVLPLFEQAMKDDVWRPIVLHCRLSLMLGDHNYSSLPAQSQEKIQAHLPLYANTDNTNKPKQTLDDHILGVTQQAIKMANFLPIFEGEPFLGTQLFGLAKSPQSLKKQSTTDIKFQWQYDAAKKITTWRQTQENLNPKHFGCFVINMASTGQGKTFANAKVMRALSEDEEGIRYILALGLRTLTLQTGDEYRQRIGLGREDLAVLIGSKAITQLHEQSLKKQENITDLKGEDEEDIYQGSLSQETLLEEVLDFEGDPQIEKLLETLLERPKDRQFLYSPVLVCTIDHIMGATETTRGGKYILPSLRLMSSDLVIDEVDDFDGADLVAIGRLIHLAGMLGRKVMLSSATLPPDMVEGFFNVYQSGWARFAQMRKLNSQVVGIWIDEFKTQISSFSAHIGPEITDQYKTVHQKFIAHRLAQLKKQVVKRKGTLVSLPIDKKMPSNEVTPLFYQAIQSAIVAQHHAHSYKDEKTGKKVSVGVVRMANITSCIELTRFLLGAEWTSRVDIRAMAYHSWQVLLMRDAQERLLDKVMKRKKGRETFLQHPEIRQHLDHSQGEHLIFILVATPVEEVGRDHDFDWAVVEPSSLRSMIQLAGRVLRHQTLSQAIGSANIALLQTNLRGLKGEEVAFTQPGYESKELKLESKDIKQLLDMEKLSQRIDASLRIQRSKVLHPHQKLDDLEHESVHRLLTDYQNLEPGRMQEWLCGQWWMTAIPQKKFRFRLSHYQEHPNLYLLPVKGEWAFCEKKPFEEPKPVERWYQIRKVEDLTPLQNQRLWLQRDYAELLKNTGKNTLEEAASIFGELNFARYKETDAFLYCSQLGLQRDPS